MGREKTFSMSPLLGPLVAPSFGRLWRRSDIDTDVAPLDEAASRCVDVRQQTSSGVDDYLTVLGIIVERG